MDYGHEIDNAVLVEECIKGDAAALNLFYTRFSPKMYGVVKRFVNNSEDAKDILHDGFLVAFSRLDSLRQPERVEYWLASIMKNLSLRFLQAQDVVSLLDEIPDVEDSPEFTEMMDLDVLESLIRKLPKGYQTVFRLSVLENKTHKEIAKILGIAPNSSSSQLFRAKMMMRKLVKEYYHESGAFLLLLASLTAGVFLWRESETGVIDNMASTEPAVMSAEDFYAGSSSEKREKVSAEDKGIENGRITFRKQRMTPRFIPIGRDKSSERLTASVIDSTDTIAEEKIIVENSEFVSGNNIDSFATESPEDITPGDMMLQDYYAVMDDYLTKKPSDKSGWTFTASVNAPISTDGLFYADNDRVASSGVPGYDSSDNNILPQNSIRYKRNYKWLAHHNKLPVSVAISANKSIANGIGIESGLAYTYLHTTIEYGKYKSECGMHYLGIPLKVTVNNYSNRHIRLYASAGFRLDIPIYSSATTSAPAGIMVLPRGRFYLSPVWSLSAGYGINVNITRNVGIFLEPSLQYHFKHSFEIPDTWTDDKIDFSLPVGLRFNF